jgi:hypothetical protein
VNVQLEDVFACEGFGAGKYGIRALVSREISGKGYKVVVNKNSLTVEWMTT